MAFCDLISQASFLYIIPMFLGYFSLADHIVVGAKIPEGNFNNIARTINVQFIL